MKEMKEIRKVKRTNCLSLWNQKTISRFLAKQQPSLSFANTVISALRQMNIVCMKREKCHKKTVHCQCENSSAKRKKKTIR